MKTWVLVIVVVCGGIAGGALAGWLVASQTVAPSLARLEALIAERPATTTAPAVQPTVEIVPIQARPSSGEAAELLRRRSPVLTLVRKAGPKEDRVVAVEREVGSAVALTSDGWLAVPAGLFAAHRAADLAAVWNGRTYPIVKAWRDTATDAAFLKIDASGLPVTALVRSQDVESGSSVWIESRPRRLYPETVSDVRLRVGTDPFSSEKSSRRFLLTDGIEGPIQGAAVWDGRGQLVGLVEAKQGDGLRVLPGGVLAGALASLLGTGTITHATLGVHATDLADAAFDDRQTLPNEGAWLRPDRRTGALAVTANGPAAKLLKDGDVIERVERDILDGTADLGERLLDYRPGTTVTFTVRQAGKETTLDIKLGEATTAEAIK